MKVKKIKINYGRTIQFEQYESTRFDVELSAEIQDDDDVDEVANELRTEAKILINKWIKLEENNNKMYNNTNKDIPF